MTSVGVAVGDPFLLLWPEPGQNVGWKMADFMASAEARAKEQKRSGAITSSVCVCVCLCVGVCDR